jgi:hypothetical protein
MAATGNWCREIQYVEPSDSCSGEPFDWQEAFHNSSGRFKGFSGPVGSGKSQALCYEGLKLAYLNAGRLGLIGAPTYPMLRDSTRKAFLELLAENEIPHRFHKSENLIYLTECRSTILFRSLDSFERIRGTNLAWFGIDELTYCRTEAWLRLEARLRDRKAAHLCGFASWTPKGFDWVYNRFISPDKKPGYEAFFAEQNPTLGDFYERLAASYDARFFEQEAMGRYLSVFSGQVYYPFARKLHMGRLPYSPRHPIWWALDFNINPMCSVIGQTINGGIRVLDELVLPDSNTMAACEEFLHRVTEAGWLQTPDPQNWQPETWEESLTGATKLQVYVYGDPSGGSRHTSSISSTMRTDWQIVKRFFSRYAERFTAFVDVPKGAPLVRDRVNCVNAMLVNQLGQRRMLVDSKCTELAKDLEQVAWKTDVSGNILSELSKKDPARTHLTDALGYYVARKFPIRGKRGEMGGKTIV